MVAVGGDTTWACGVWRSEASLGYPMYDGDAIGGGLLWMFVRSRWTFVPLL